MNIEEMKLAAGVCRTPFYVFDTDELCERVTTIREMLKGVASVCFAIKANPFMVKALEGCVDKYEICSPGEYHIYEELEMPGNTMVYSGVYKDRETLFRALEHYCEDGIFTAESMQHFALLREWSKTNGRSVQVYLRLTSGNQFGMDEEVIREIIRNRAEYPQVRIEGIHYFSGTQKRKLERIEKELTYLDRFCMELESEYRFQVKNLEYGPGASISYFPSDKHVLTTEETVLGMRNLLEKMQFSGHVTLEMGRFLAAMCGYYFTTICDVKQNAGENYCIVDGGIHQMNYDGQLKGMYLPYMKFLQRAEDGTYMGEDVSKTDDEEVEKWNICGALCTGNDVICRAAPLGEVAIGDVLVLERVGAYSVTEGMLHFLSRNLPEVFFYSENEGLVSVRKPIESYRMNRPEI